jgi:hypothetical protein
MSKLLIDKEVIERATEFNRYFLSMNKVDVPQKITVDPAEWRALFGVICAAQTVQSEPKKRLIDWSQMPKGTMTNFGTLLSANEQYAETVSDSEYSNRRKLAALRLAEQPEFEYWAGGECPVPEGVVVEAVRRDGVKFQTAPTHPEAIAYDWQHDLGDQDIIAFRIIGLSDGWTDNPEDAA